MRKITKYLLLAVLVIVFLSAVGCGNVDDNPDDESVLPRFTWEDIYDGDYNRLDSEDVASHAERLLGYYERTYFYSYRFRSQQTRDFPLYDYVSDVNLQGVANVSSDKLKVKLNAFVDAEYTKVALREKSTLDGMILMEGFVRDVNARKYYLDCNASGESELTVYKDLSMSGKNIFAYPSELITSEVSYVCNVGKYPYTVYNWLNNLSQNETLSFYQCGKNKYKAVYESVGEDGSKIKIDVYFCIDDNDLLCVKAITTDNSAKGTLVQTTEARPIGFEVKMPANADEFNEAQHCHTYDDKWTFDENVHWIVPTCDCKNVRLAYGGHDLNGGVCSVCGYDPAYKDDHEHTYSDKWSFDLTTHWHEPTCGHTGIASDKGEHEYKDGICFVCGHVQPTGVRYRIVTDENNEPLYAGVDTTLRLTERDVTIESTYMNLPVKFVSYGAFKDFKDLRSVTLPDTIEYIEGIAFENCTSLESIVLPNGVKQIDDGAFAGCTSLKRVVMPSTLTQIGAKAFYGCSQLSDINLPDMLEIIGKKAFYDCSQLVSVTLPATLEKIDDNAFCGCVRLAEVVNNSALNIVAGQTDNGLVAYYAVYVHAGSSSVETGGDFTVLSYPNKTYVVRYDGKERTVVLPTLTAKECTLSKYAFYRTDNIDEVVLPSNYTEVGKYAFAESSVSSVQLPDTLKKIGTAAFKSCGSLKNINVPGGVKVIESDTFACSGLESVTIADGVEKIDYNAFESCESLSSVIVGEGVQTVGYNAFANCSQLEYVQLPSTLKTVSHEAFSVRNATKSVVVNIASLSDWCSIEFATESSNPLSHGGKLQVGGEEITALVIPEDVTTIKQYCFYKMKNAVDVVLHDNLERVSGKAFYGSSVTSVKLPQNVVLDSKSFASCSKLDKVYLVDIKTWILYSANASLSQKYDLYLNGEKVTRLQLTSNVGIPSYTFRNCKSLTEVELDGAEAVYEYAFANCENLNSVNLVNVKRLAEFAFEGCSNLKTLNLPATLSKIDTNALDGCDITSLTVGKARTTR